MTHLPLDEAYTALAHCGVCLLPMSLAFYATRETHDLILSDPLTKCASTRVAIRSADQTYDVWLVSDRGHAEGTGVNLNCEPSLAEHPAQQQPDPVVASLAVACVTVLTGFNKKQNCPYVYIKSEHEFARKTCTFASAMSLSRFRGVTNSPVM